MPTGADGKHYRSHGQAARFGGKKDAKSESNAVRGNEVEDKGDKPNMAGSTKHIMAIKHGGTPEMPAPPFHVKHADGSTHGPMDSKEELMEHMSEHMGGEMQDEDAHSNDGAIDDMADGSKEAIEGLLG
jgi:hypothetical protein